MTKTNNAIVITSIISGVILVVALVALLSLSPSSGETINVEGMATVKAMPDLIGIYFNIETKADTSSEAESKNAEILNELITQLVVQEGFDRDEIVTESFSVRPNYVWTNGQRKEEGYIATHSVSVKIDTDETSRAGRIVDIGVEAGAGINYINFELTQESQNKYKAEAMKLAAEDARIKAESVAAGFGKKIDELVSVQVSDFGYYPWMAYGAMESSMDAKTAVSNIQPGEEDISARITATFSFD